MKVIIFGNSDSASVTYSYLTHDSEHEVVAFTVDDEYIGDGMRHGLPVLPFSNIEKALSPNEYKIIVALGSTRACNYRAERYLQAKQKGYDFISYIASSASVSPDALIGKNTMICCGVNILPFAEVGNNVIVRTGSNISHHNKIEDHCVIGPGCTLAGSVHIKSHSFIGAGVTIKPNTVIANHNMIGAGAVVVKDTEKSGVYVGMPAKRIKDNI